MTTSTKELIDQINIEANYAYRATDKTGGILYQTLMQAAQRLRELDKPDCVWTPLITTVETNVNFYKQRCVTNIMVREMPTKLTSFCPNCGGAVKEAT
jgi:hypothetical protein